MLDSDGEFKIDWSHSNCSLNELLGEEWHLHKDPENDDFHTTEQIDLTNVPEDKVELYKKTAREFYFKTFTPKPVDEDDEPEDQ